MNKQLLDALKGDHPIIYVVSSDERPIVETVSNYALEHSFQCYSWDISDGGFNEIEGKQYVSSVEGKQKKLTPELFLHNLLFKRKENTIAILSDFHNELSSDKKQSIENIRLLKNFVYDACLPFTKDFTSKKYSKIDNFNKKLILISPVLNVPKELENFVHIIEYSLPDRSYIEKIITSFLIEKELNTDNHNIEKIIDACSGLTEIEIMITIKKIFHLFNGQIDIEAINKEKEQIIKREGILEIVHSKIQMKDVGGFDQYKKWLDKRKILLNKETRDKFKLQYPKGTLITGIPGCGKSLIAKAIGNDWGMPIIRFDMGSILGSKLGESDRKLKKALKTIENLSPCILWIDEIEKSFPKSNENSHEVVTRLFGYFLTWLQEKESLVFVFATANNIGSLPPEFLRKGRFDEIFFVDLPQRHEREKILTIHLEKHFEDISLYDLSDIVKRTKGFTGSELEALVQEAILTSIEKNETFSEHHILYEIHKTTPISTTMKASIDEIRTWCSENQIKNVSTLGDEQFSMKNIGFTPEVQA